MKKLTAFLLSATTALACFAANPTLTIDATHPVGKVSPRLYGLMTEEINHSYDGGLYAELIRNRAFLDDASTPIHWSVFTNGGGEASIALDPANAFNDKLTTSLRLTVTKASKKEPAGVANSGYWGIPVQPNTRYHATLLVKAAPGFTGPVTVSIVSDDGSAVYASKSFSGLGADWKKCEIPLKTGKVGPTTMARFALALDRPGTIWISFVSLFPPTWNARPNGLRKDLMQMLVDMNPKFLRFPGGNYLEGDTIESRFDWKKTIGPVAERQLLVNRWNYEFLHRPAPDYYQSFGLGFYEFFQLCEDIGAQPLPILNCGLACQFNSGEACRMEDLDAYIQDALDLIEFANGPTNSVWGAKRATMGHPEPFNLKMMGVGNENWDQPYIERYTRFHAVLKEKHPEIQIVSSAGPFPDDARFKFAWAKLRELHADIIDEHCYAKPDWFFNNTHRFDGYDRNGPKVFFGEYAAQSDKVASVKNRNNLECAIAEAAYMTGLERNGEVLLKPFSPPYYPTMTDAVRAAVEIKFGANGVFRSESPGSAWTRHREVSRQVPPISDAAIAGVAETLFKSGDGEKGNGKQLTAEQLDAVRKIVELGGKFARLARLCKSEGLELRQHEG